MSDNEEHQLRQYHVRIDSKPTPFRWSGKANGPIDAAALAFIQAMNAPEIGEEGLMNADEFLSVAEVDDAGEVRIVVSIKVGDAANAAGTRIRYQRELIKGRIADYFDNSDD